MLRQCFKYGFKYSFKYSLVALLLASLIACGGAPKKPAIVIEKTPEDALPVLSEQEKSQFSKALNLMTEGSLAEAESLFNSLLSKQPKLTGAYVNLALIRKQQNKLEDAQSFLTQALKINPNFIDALMQQAMLFQDQGEFSKAEESLRRAEAINPEHPLVNYNLGVLYELYLQEYPLAIKYYKRYVSLSNADDVETVRRWIMLLERK